DPLRESDGQRYGRECRVDVAAGRKGRGAGDEEVAHPVDGTVLVQDALLLVDVHPGRPEMVMGCGKDLGLLRAAQSPDAGSREGLAQDLLSSQHAVALPLGDAPVQPWKRLPERVPGRRESDPA